MNDRRTARRPTLGLGVNMNSCARVVLVLVAISIGGLATSDGLECFIGPIEAEVGGTKWQVTSCNDDRSLVFAAMKDNPAMPFVFIIQRDGETSHIHGEGNGSKTHSAKAFDDLKAMTERQFDEYVRATKQVNLVQ